MLEVKGLTVRYGVGQQAHAAVNGMSFTVARGEVVGLLGESGSGKSTAALAVLGLVRPGGEIVGGTVVLDGESLLGISDDEWRQVRGRRIGLITQHPRASLNPTRTVGEQIADAYRAHCETTKEEARQRSIELLSFVGINDPERRLSAYPLELSGGMAQRVLIAMALAGSAELLIADEPTSGLDVTVQAQLLDDLRNAVAELGSGLLIVSQDLGIVANYCDRVYVVHAGEVVEEAPTRELFRAPRHPVSAALLSVQYGTDHSLRLRGFPVDGRRLPSGCFVHLRCPLAETTAGCSSVHPELETIDDERHLSRCHRVEAVRDAWAAAQATSEGSSQNAVANDGVPQEREPHVALVEIDHLTKRFPLRGSKQVVHALDDLTLTVYEGETLGLIGESGSGKTTVARCILRLIEPTSGEVRFQSDRILDLGKRDLRALRSQMQIVFQEPAESLNPKLTVGYQIGEPLRIHTTQSRPERRDRVAELLKLVGLPPDVASALPNALSAGTLQRCAIARALATEPKLLVLDEPTSALAPEAEAEIIELLQRLQQQFSLTYVFVSHDLSLVEAICDRVAVMYLGQVVELARRSVVFDSPRHPYSRALLASVLLPDPDRQNVVSRKAERLEGEIPSPINLPPGCYLASRCPYVRDRCRTERQALREVEPLHWARCWRMVEGDLTSEEFDDVRERKMAQGTAPEPVETGQTRAMR